MVGEADDARIARELAELADARHRDPAEALRRTRELAGEELSPQLRATADWVEGLALHELGQPADAVARYRRSIAGASVCGDRHIEATARASAAVSLASLGEMASATSEIERSVRIAPPSARPAVQFLLGLLQQRTGRLDEALATYGRALTALRRAGDDANVARLLLNRGTLRAYQGHTDRALADLRGSEALATDLELWVLVAMAAHNLGFAQGRHGDIPAALAAFDRAESAYSALGDPPRLVAVLEADRCDVYLAAGLGRDARAAAERALELLEPTADASHLSETRLLMAQACVAQGDYAQARIEAGAAANEFRRARRKPWAALADYVTMQAEVLATEDDERPPAGLLRRARRIAAELDAEGWPGEALHVRTFVGRIALAQNRPDVVRRELAGAARLRQRGPVEGRAQAWHATALVRLADGNRVAARGALRRGLRLLDDHRASFTATELRAGAAARGADLARLGLRMALADGRAWEVLRWAEQGRAGSLRLPPLRPPRDDQLARTLEQLRERRAERRDAALSGAPTAELDAAIARIEAAVRAATLRSQRQQDAGAGGAVFEPAALKAALGDRALVELVAMGGDLHAVVVMNGRAKLHQIGRMAPIAEELEYLRFGLRRQLASGRSAPAAPAVDRLDRLLLADLGLPPEVPVVIVPTGGLHGTPWRALATMSGRPVTVAPSAASWHSPRLRSRRRRQGVALIAGPDLPGAVSEVTQLGARLDGARVVAGTAATVTATLALFQSSYLVHLAAHGQFRADSPQFSSLRMSDGVLTVYDLELVRHAPQTVVLPACDAGRSAVGVGDELLGTAAAMTRLGVRSVIAPVLPVPDAPTTDLMVALHDRLAGGEAPSVALATAGVDHPVSAAFVCIGGDERVA